MTNKRKRRNFCDINPFFYKISYQKEVLKRHLKNFSKKENFAKEIRTEKLPIVVSSHSNNIIKRGEGIDIELQQNKAVNLEIAAATINGLIVKPGEVFSFWDRIGKITEKKGYKKGRIIHQGKVVAGIGGGLCNLGNTINWLIIHSPLEIVEIHTHSDALDASMEATRVPFGSGVSVEYNYIDYRFRNNSNQNIQLCVWCEDEKLMAELRSEEDFGFEYKIVEEDHHFKEEDGVFYRNSKIYQCGFKGGELITKKLVWDNHSRVMFDSNLIPKDMIKAEE